MAYTALSQSPYGAKWFATRFLRKSPLVFRLMCRNPLTGLSGLQLFPQARGGGEGQDVAIPLRG